MEADLTTQRATTPAEGMKLCGAVRLLSAIFGYSKDKVWRKLGLKPPRTCFICGASLSHTKMFCSWECYKEYRRRYCHITVICEYCGKTFQRRRGELVWRIGKRNYQHIFCSFQCFSKFRKEHPRPGRRKSVSATKEKERQDVPNN